MPIIPPPPTPPRKQTIAVRLELEMVNELRRYAAYLNSDNSYIVTYALKELFADDDWKKWLKAHPELHPPTKGRRKSTQGSGSDQASSHSSSAVPITVPERQVDSRNSIGGA